MKLQVYERPICVIWDSVFYISSAAQEYVAESLLMDCIYKGYNDEGLALKNNNISFERLLIDERILTNSTSQGYKTVLTKIANDPYFDYYPSRAFIAEELRSVEQDSLLYQFCESEMRITASIDFTKVDRLKKVLDSIAALEDWAPTDMAKGVLSVLDGKDFEQDYYKLQIFPIFNMINFAPLSDKIFPGLRESEELIEYAELSNAMEIYLDEKNRINVNDKIETITGLKIKVRDYEYKNKSKSILIIRTHGQSIFKYYREIRTAIIEEIHMLREQLAVEKFKMELNKLSDVQTDYIKNIYPQKIVVQ